MPKRLKQEKATISKRLDDEDEENEENEKVVVSEEGLMNEEENNYHHDDEENAEFDEGGIGLELNPADLMREMNEEEEEQEEEDAGTNKKKRKRRKNNKQQQNRQQHGNKQNDGEENYQKAFYVVDQDTVKKINWKPPEKQWLKTFFEKKEDNAISASNNNDEETMQDDEDMDEIDKEAQRYLLNVRFEAQNFCAKTVVATNIDSKKYEQNRSNIKDIDSSLYSALHLFDAFMGNATNQSTIVVTREWEQEFLNTFRRERDSVQFELDKRLHSKQAKEKSNNVGSSSSYPSLNGNYDAWKLYCLGEDNIYVLWEKLSKSNNSSSNNNKEGSTKKKKSRRGGRKRAKKDENSEDKMEDDTSEPEATPEVASSSDVPEELRSQENTEMVTTEILQSSNASSSSNGEGKIPTQTILTSYLDYVTTHALFSKMTHWTVSSFHNNSLLRRNPQKANTLFNTEESAEEEDDDKETEENSTKLKKEQWMSNYLLTQSKESNNILRCNWLYHLLLAIDKPPTDTIGANMNQLLLWILENFSNFTIEEREEFTKLILIIIKYFGQGNPELISYKTNDDDHQKQQHQQSLTM